MLVTFEQVHLIEKRMTPVNSSSFVAYIFTSGNFLNYGFTFFFNKLVLATDFAGIFFKVNHR